MLVFLKYQRDFIIKYMYIQYLHNSTCDRVLGDGIHAGI